LLNTLPLPGSSNFRTFGDEHFFFPVNDGYEGLHIISIIFGSAFFLRAMPAAQQMKGMHAFAAFEGPRPRLWAPARAAARACGHGRRENLKDPRKERDY
jgi:hypothetical protein